MTRQPAEPPAPNLWDLTQGTIEKKRGQARAAFNRAQVLQRGREVAEQIARERVLRTCTADDVQKRLEAEGLEIGPAMASVFRGKQWRFTGRFMKSKRVANHARLLRIWYLLTPEELEEVNRGQA